MSHEIRTPMNAVIGLLELLSLTELNGGSARNFVHDAGVQPLLLTLIDDVLDFSKIEAGKLEVVREPCAVGHVVDGVVGVSGGGEPQGDAAAPPHRCGALARAPGRRHEAAPDPQQLREQRDKVQPARAR